MQCVVARSFLVCVLSLLGLVGAWSLVGTAGCGSGGGTPPGPNNQSIMIPVEDDAQVTATFFLPWNSPGLSLVAISLGDDTQNNAYRGLMRFPLSSIPSGANVVGAFLHLEFLDRLGMPGDLLTGELGGLGDIEFYRLAGTPLGGGDFDAPTLAYDSDNDLTADTPNQAKTTGALAMLQSALAAGDTHLKVRVQYELPTDNDGVLDQLRMGTRNSQNGAVLEVVIQP